jgi:hypothetical protein
MRDDRSQPLQEVILRYQKDIEGLPSEKIKEISEVLDAFLCDLKISQWEPEAVGYDS